MPNTAVMWIRDGVLVDRMHINPVAFAFALFLFAPPKIQEQLTLEGLINFAFDKSGASCHEKMQLYIRHHRQMDLDIDRAANYYNWLASEAAESATYFSNAPKLLQDLQKAGARNYITSAVEQSVLDTWSNSLQGKTISPYLTQILGKREGFTKGRDHFEHVRRLGHRQIFYVADAAAEIATGKQYCAQFNIVLVGFANVVTAARVMEASKLLGALILKQSAANITPHPVESKKLTVDINKIHLANKLTIEASLKEAGADCVIGGSPQSIMQSLRDFFIGQNVLQDTSP